MNAMWDVNRKIIFGMFALSTFALFPSLAGAGGAFSTTKAGDKVLWENGKVFYRMDPGGPEDGSVPEEPSSGGGGGGGCFLVKPAYASTIKGLNVTDMVTHGFKQWSDQAGDGLEITRGPDLPENVTFANAENYYVGTFQVEPFVSTVTADPCYSGDTANCLNSVIIDPHGLITDGILGQCARFSVFGFASILPKRLDDSAGTITSKNLKAAQMVVNGTCVTPVDPPWSICQGNPNFGFSQCPIEMDQKGLQGVVTHELGHFLGLDHVLVQKDLYLKCSAEDASCSADELEKIPTMIGLAVPGADLDTLTQDDKSIIKGFYPGTGAQCSIKGVVQTSGGGNGRCFEVVARKQGDPDFVVAAVSGAYVPRNSQGESCGATNPDGSMNEVSYAECLSQPNAASTLKVHTNCATVPGNCGKFEMFGVENGIYDLTIQTFRDPNGGHSIPFILEPCDQVRNEGGLVNQDKQDAGSVSVTCPVGADLSVPIVID
jgi:hypothetical protein